MTRHPSDTRPVEDGPPIDRSPEARQRFRDAIRAHLPPPEPEPDPDPDLEPFEPPEPDSEASP